MIKVKKEAKHLNIILSRPEKRNAFDAKMIEGLARAFLGAANDSELRAVVLSGEGASFCAGADLEFMKSMVNFSLQENQEDSYQLFDMFKAAYDLPMPLICKVHGHVFGGALGLLATSDFAVAEEKTKFCFSEVKLGIAPAVISPFVLQKMQPPTARRYMLSAEVFDVNTALLSGLVQKQESGDGCDEVVGKWLSAFYQNGPEGVRETKKLLRQTVSLDWSGLRQQTAKVIAERRVSDEGQKGLNGFLNKTEPDWKLQWP